MASNIKIVGNIINTSTVERYAEEDRRLITSKRKQELFGGKNDYIEYFVYDAGENLLNADYDYLDYKLPSSSFLNPSVSSFPNSTGQIQTTGVGIESSLASTTSSIYPIIEIDPIQDLQDVGYSSGEFKVRYNFFERKISNFIDEGLFIKEISRDRTEIRLGSVILSDEEIESGSLALIEKINNTEDYYVDYILNFGNNQQYVAVNVALNRDPEGYEVLFKLYKPLPSEVQEKQTLWVVEEKVTPYTFDINLDKLIIPPPPPTLRGPNFDIELDEQGTVSSPYQNYSNLISSLQSLQSSSYSQLQSLITSQSIDINVDYNNFNNFVFFGSAYQRVNNFYNKVKSIELLQSEINFYSATAPTTASLQLTLNQYSASINNIIAEFDGFEYYLYFNSGSSLTSSVDYSITPYPKSGSVLPYTLLSSSASTVTTWYDYATESALAYDRDNNDNLEYAIPFFLKENDDNQPFLLFLNMVGHYFDNIWIYLKAVTDINLANNNLDYGISRDLVYQQLKSLGVRLYNSQARQSVDGYLLGANTGSVLWNNDFSPTSSYLNNIPRKDLVAELYKRIYHNLPLLLKTKGTVAGLNNLMTVFGIPNRTYYTVGSESFYTPTGSAATASILNVKEFGGSLKSELINGYNNDKVRVVQNLTSGSVLSPLLSLQEYPTTSSEFRDDDLAYVDISFSPQTQIDTYISGAITSNNPSWSLDDYIGDPSQLYSGSYSDLDAQRKLYYQTGVSGFNPFTASLLDYNGFIRLIEFFDNSLFKMLNDFVPERTSLSTGVTINSPVLERNKAAYSKPTVATQSVHEANYDIADISSQYGNFYNALSASNNTMAWYDGNISGSVVDINQYFEDNYNPYLLPSASLTPTDINFFNHSDWNVLLNNVSKSIDSQYRKKIEYFYGTTGSITSSVELQDSYLSLKSYNTSRYSGSQTTSLLYNTYTSGDKSYGNTAAIDKIKLKYAYLVDIYSASLYLPGRSNAQIKYLIENDSSVLNLTKANFNLFDVQNIFKSGETCDVSLFKYDEENNYTQLLANNPTLRIYEGGFRYLPILHNLTGSATIQRFTLLNPVRIDVSTGGSPIVPGDIVLSYNVSETEINPPTDSNYSITVVASYEPGGTPTPVTSRTNVQFSYNIYLSGNPTPISSGTAGATIFPSFYSSFPVTILSNYEWPSYRGSDFSVELTLTSAGGGSTSGSISTYWTTEVTSSVPCIFFNTSSQQLVFNSTIAQYYSTNGIIFDSTSDTPWTGSGLERVVLPFTLNTGDRISIYDSASRLGWDEKFEFTIASVSITGSGTGSRLLATTYEPVNTSNLLTGTTDSVTGANYRTCRYIIWKHVPDETNVMLKYNPKDPTLIEKGLLFPQYIEDGVKKNAGNTVQTLTRNNLISE